ncbi:MAG: metal ABC transporter substrate-binding protein [Nitrososphaeraceae archaeon]|nr:metal ABC transporter substrate-binding protein [Nitrososphaeraceae archaeon]
MNKFFILQISLTFLSVCLVIPHPSFSSLDLQKESIITNPDNHTRLQVVTSFYPLYEFTKAVGGDKIDLTTLIPFGVEPHDWEPSPQKISQLQNADLIIYNGIGFDSWLKDRVDKSKLVDVSDGVHLIELQQEDKESTNVKSSFDPHIWLDPIIAKNISKSISSYLIKLDPANSDYYKQNTERFVEQLDLLDYNIKKSISDCKLNEFISFHEAFQYLANRYGLTQYSVQGLSPEGEILPQQISKIISLAKNLNISTIYSEDLRDPRLAEILASEIPNGNVLVLSPIEGIDKVEQENNISYIDKMKTNINNLAIGLGCN